MKDKTPEVKDVCLRTINVETLREYSYTNFNLSYGEDGAVASVCISAKEFAEYMERNQYHLLEIWVHTFEDSCTAICLKTPTGFVEINQVPYINQQANGVNSTETKDSSSEKSRDFSTVMNAPERMKV